MDFLHGFNVTATQTGINKSNSAIFNKEAIIALDSAYALLVEMSCLDSDSNLILYARSIFDVESSSPLSVIDSKYDTFLRIVSVFTILLRNDNLSLLPPLHNVYSPTTALQITIKHRIDKLTHSIFSMHQSLYHLACLERTHVSTEVSPPFEGLFLSMEVFDDAKNEAALTDQHRLILYALHKLSMMNAKRFREWVMVPKYTNGKNYNTTAYVRLIEIANFLPTYVNRSEHPLIWRILANHENAGKWAAKFLQEHKNPEFPDLQRSRTRFAFSNGIYEARYNKFTPYTVADRRNTNTDNGMSEEDLQNLESIQHADEEIYHALLAQWDFTSNLENPSAASRLREQELHMSDGDGLIHDEAACVYFDTDYVHFNGTEDYMSIPTPYLDTIFKAQDFHKNGTGKNDMPYDGNDVMSWTYALIGRMLYDVNSVDEWQIAPFYKGVAGTGKSTILRIIRMFYETDDVGIMSNNIEGKFGLAALYTKLVVLCFELRSDFGLDQADLQSIISGEEMSVPVKFKTALPIIKWVAPIAVAGNMTADWDGSQGAMSRRWVIHEFKRPVKDSDPMLMRNIQGEIAAIIAKVNRAYLTMVRKHGSRNVWAKNAQKEPMVLPQIFHDHADALNVSLNSLLSFIKSGGVISLYDEIKDNPNCPSKDLFYMSWTKFTEAYDSYCKGITCKKVRLQSAETYESLFATYGLQKLLDTKLDTAQNRNIMTEWVIGCLPVNAAELNNLC